MFLVKVIFILALSHVVFNLTGTMTSGYGDYQFINTLSKPHAIKIAYTLTCLSLLSHYCIFALLYSLLE